MNIQQVNRDNQIYQLQKSQAEIPQTDKMPDTDDKSAKTKSDTLEISNEAKTLQTTNPQQQNIMSNIGSGYYNRPDVVRNVAAAVNNAIPAEGNLSK